MTTQKIKPIPFLLQGKNIVIIIGNKPHTVTESHINYNELKAAIIAKDWESVPNLVTPMKALQKYIKGHFECVDGVITEGGAEVHNALTERILSMYDEGFSIDPMLAFYKNIKANPSEESANELYEFLEKNSLPITEDGCFVAYKRVRENYTDVHSGTFDNSIGQVVSMDRKGVDSNRNNECSNGLHFCSHSYLAHFEGDKIVVVKVNPADVVSIPRDYNNAKGRAWKYEVIGEVTDTSENDDTLSKVAVYEYEYVDQYDKEYHDKEADKDDTELFDDEWNQVYALSLRDQAQVWNILTGGTLRKFSYRKDVDRRMYESGDFTKNQIVEAASSIGLV